MVRVCSACGQKNRIPLKKLSARASCGNCKGALPALSHPIDVNQRQFDEIVGAAEVPVLVDFWAEWCGPCRMAAPEVARVAREAAGRALVLKVNTDAEQALAARYQIRGIPNFMVFQNGRPVRQQAGLVRHTEMIGWLEEAKAA